MHKYLAGVLFLLVLTSYDVSGQRRPSIKKIRSHDHFSGMFNPGDPSSDFLTTQYWLGYKSGASLTTANVINSFSLFNPIGSEEEIQEKDYKNLKGVTGHAGLELTLYHRGFYFSLQPSFRRHSFTFNNEFLWESSADPTRNISQELSQTQKLDYIDMPFLVKYDLIQGSVKPFIQAGAFYGKLVGATRSIDRKTTDNASGAAGSILEDNFTLNNRNAFINTMTGYIFGIGLNADVTKVRIIFDLQYRKSFNNITNVNTRFDDDRLSSFGDVLDDTRLTNFSANIGILFPLKYLGSGQTVNKK